MSITVRLTLQFVAISALILLVSLVSIFVLSENYREEEFYDRLSSRAVNIAKLLLTVEEIDESLLYRIERDNPVRLSFEAIRIYNYRNDLIFSMDEEGMIEVDSLFLNRVRLDSSFTYQKGEREYLAFLYSDRYDRFAVVASAIDVYGLRKIRNLRNMLFIVFGCSLLVVFVAGRVYAARAIRPVKKLVEEVDEITPANLRQRVSEGRERDELGRLAAAFNAMLERVEAAFLVQKNFIANASHEMRTPLTAISGQMEVLLLKDRSPEEYREKVEAILEDMHQLNRLANRLLLLAQTGTDAPEVSFDRFRVDEVVWQCAAELSKLGRDYSVHVEMDASIDDDQKLVVRGSEQLIKAVVTNLMENGCKYSEGHTVRVKLVSGEGELQLWFVDDGIGIPAEEIPHVFDPFFRATNARKLPGHGIGMSLVKRIIDLHRGRVAIHSIEGEGTTVTVYLPLDRSAL